jgi:hypothetical protein
LGQPQNNFVVVASSVCTSSPMTVSHADAMRTG